MTQKILMFIAVVAYLFAILLMLRNGFGNKAGIEFGFVIFLVVGGLSAIIGNAMSPDSWSD